MEIREIIEETKNKKTLPNKKLVEMMNFLAEEHEKTKKNLINLTYYFDKIEETYNLILEEYEQRNGAGS